MGLRKIIKALPSLEISKEGKEAIGMGAAVGTAVTYALSSIAAASAFATPVGIGAALLTGAAVYFHKRTQKAALTAIEQDGLTPEGKPIANGLEAQGTQILLSQQNQK